MRRITLSFTLLTLFGSLGAYAQNTEVPDPPALPTAEEYAAAEEAAKSRPIRADDVREYTEGGHQVTEYRRGGGVYMVRVTPAAGLTQYYVDHDGDGLLQNDDGIGNDFNVAKWRLGNW